MESPSASGTSLAQVTKWTVSLHFYTPLSPTLSPLLFTIHHLPFFTILFLLFPITVVIFARLFLTLATGAAVIFAQFQSINQFRVIGWYNAAWGVALMILFVVMFRGESGCSKSITCCKAGTGNHRNRRKLLNCTPKPIQGFISFLFYILSCMVLV